MTEFTRDAAAVAAILGFFAAAWFGWAQDDPPSRWKPWLVAGGVGGMILAVVGGVSTWLNWNAGTALDRSASIRFGWIVLAEVLIAATGVLLLRRTRRAGWIPAWVAFVVGAHFIPLASLFTMSLLYLLAGVLMVGAVAAIRLATGTGVTVSALTGSIAGSSLLIIAIISLAFGGVL